MRHRLQTLDAGEAQMLVKAESGRRGAKIESAEMPPGIADGVFDEEPADARAALTFQDIDMTYASDPEITHMGIDAASADADERFVEEGTGQHLARPVEAVIGIALPTLPEPLEHPESMP